MSSLALKGHQFIDLAYGTLLLSSKAAISGQVALMLLSLWFSPLVLLSAFKDPWDRIRFTQIIQDNFPMSDLGLYGAIDGQLGCVHNGQIFRRP